MGGAGLGLVAADGEQHPTASPVNLGMAQRMDDLFEAMSDTQVAAVLSLTQDCRLWFLVPPTLLVL